MWEMYEKAGPQAGIGMAVFEDACSPGANLLAVSYRHTQVIRTLMMLQEQAGFSPQQFPDSLRNIFPDGKVDDAAFRVAAKTPLEWPGLGPGTATGTPISYFEAVIRQIRDDRDETAA